MTLAAYRYSNCFYAVKGEAYTKPPLLFASDVHYLENLFRAFDQVGFNSYGEVQAFAAIETPIGTVIASYIAPQRHLALFTVEGFNSSDKQGFWAGDVPRINLRSQLESIVRDALRETLGKE